jgi:antitoxin component YwqK of YwqJK toxin-antitoxin module
MKNLSLTFCLGIAALASPVWSESLNDLVIREGLLFPKFSDELFNGRVDGMITGNVRNGLWDGEYLEFRDDGQLKTKIIFKDGKIESPIKKFSGNDYTQGPWAEYNLVMRDGILFSKFSNKPFNGEISGKLKTTIQDGLWNGKYLQFWENGQLKVKVHYKNGQLDGTYKTFSKFGQVQNKEFYKNGVLDGLKVTYYSNGRYESKESYKIGVKDGFFETYYETGRLKSKSFFKDGEQDDLWETYYEDGEIKERKSFKDGVQVSSWKIIIDNYQNGQLKSKSLFKDG